MKGKEKLRIIGVQNGDFEKEINELRGVVYMIKSMGREQILAIPHKTDIERRETTFTFHTLKDERTDKIGTSQGQCQIFQTTRKDETIRCYGQ